MAPEVANDAARRAISDRHWAFVRQVHGAEVVRADPGVRPEADGLVTDDETVALALLGADCALVGLASENGIRGAAHAGWRGLLAGVLEATVALMRDLGAGEIAAVVSPTIHVECYRFSPPDLEPLVARYGPDLAGRASDGAPALDLPRGVELALERAGVPLLGRLGGCTACDDRYFSWRARRDTGRHALVVSSVDPR